MASLLTHPIVPLAAIEASPLSARRFLSARGWQIFQSELTWAWTPLLLLALPGHFIRKRLCASH